MSDSILGVAFSAILYLLLGLLFHFQAFIAGGVRFAAGLLYYGGAVTHEGITLIPTGLFLGVFLGYTALYAAVLTCCRFYGAQKRIIDRAELRKNEKPDEDTN